VLEIAARMAVVEGLDRLSLARLARAARMSKSGVFGLFGSKEELQMAVVDKARQIFTSEVVAPALTVPSGAERLLALCEGYLDHIEHREWPHGCFFASVAAEVGGRAGPVRDRVAADQKQWVGLLTDNARKGLKARRLKFAGSPEQLALELSAMLTGVDIAYLLHGEAELLRRIRVAIRSRLEV
jgi:AcrR family transcriptional regulator